VEVCIECAPDSQMGVGDWRKYLGKLVGRTVLPVTRVSFGIQSLDGDTLMRMGRRGGTTAVDSLLRAVDQLLPTYNADILIGYPEAIAGQSVNVSASQTASALSGLLADGYRLPSLSLYQLWDTDTIPLLRRPGWTLPAKQPLLEAKWYLQSCLYDLG